MKLPKFSSKLMLAPMKVVNDVAFRLMCHNYGSAMQFTEMINVGAVIRKNKAVLNLAKTLDEEKPVGIQLLGSKIDLIKKAINILENDYPEKINPNMFDFNFGCSSNIITKQGAGAALLKRPKKIGEIIKAMRSSTDLPISAKIRLGTNKASANYIKIAKIIEKNGADMIIVHARYQNQNYTTPADWKAIREIKEKVNIPIVGNGDAIDDVSAKKMINKTNCDYVMIGRAALGNPFIFYKINHFLTTGERIKQKNRKKLFKEYLFLAEKFGIKQSVVKQQEINFRKNMVLNKRF